MIPLILSKDISVWKLVFEFQIKYTQLKQNKYCSFTAFSLHEFEVSLEILKYFNGWILTNVLKCLKGLKAKLQQIKTHFCILSK